MVVDIKEGTYCLEHWVRCINNGFWKIKKNKLKKEYSVMS